MDGSPVANAKAFKGLSRSRSGDRTGIALDALRRSLFDNQVRPGDCLSENGLARSLGMSRTPVREAVKVLASEGLLEIHHGVGIFVKPVTTREIVDLFEVRAALECAALPTAMAHISDQELDAVLEAWLAQKRRLDAGETLDPDQISELDFNLHFLIVDRCENLFLKHTMNSIRLKIKRYQRISARALADDWDAVDQHVKILACMKRRDLDALAKVLKEHIRNAAENIIRNPHWAV
jgi:DNA-binding GntR family transcriptional regulator